MDKSFEFKRLTIANEAFPTLILFFVGLLLFLLGATACVLHTAKSPKVKANMVSVSSDSIVTPESSPSGLLDLRVNINTATQSELEMLPGVGPALAARVIEYRQRYGPFRRPEEIILVRGFSERRFCRLKPYITVK